MHSKWTTQAIAPILCGLLTAAGAAYGENTAGVFASPYAFNQPNLVEIRWTTAVPAFDSLVNLLRSEFNGVALTGPSGTIGLVTMLQNTLHQYPDGSCAPPAQPLGLELYFRVFDTPELDPPLFAGMRLDSDPDVFPRFRRIFANIDMRDRIGNSVYNNDAIGTPREAQPVLIEWHVQRGNLVTDPMGDVMKKDLECNPLTLTGDFREWSVDVTVDGTNYPAATFYVTDVYAQYLSPTRPFVLNQEHFGACYGQLAWNEGDVRYFDFRVRQEGSPSWIPITTWTLNNSRAGNCTSGGSPDIRFGLGTGVFDGMKTIISRVGHQNDVSLKRCSDDTLKAFCPSPILLSTAATGNEVAIENPAVVGLEPTSATIEWTTTRDADGIVRYGTTSEYGGTSAWSATPASAHSASLTDLQDETTYFYRIESIDADGHLASVDGEFTTPASPVPGVPVTISTSGATHITQTCARLAAYVDTLGIDADLQFDYGTTSSFGLLSDVQTVNTNRERRYNQQVCGLNANTTYFFRGFVTWFDPPTGLTFRNDGNVRSFTTDP
jgi:Purple acid Phosphatase, N-terminal domain